MRNVAHMVHKNLKAYIKKCCNHWKQKQKNVNSTLQ